MYDFLNSVTVVNEKNNLSSIIKNKLSNKECFTEDWNKLSKNNKKLEAFIKNYTTPTDTYWLCIKNCKRKRATKCK